MGSNNISLKQVRAFVTVADRGSFVAAAESLCLSQPALSQTIRQLETEIGSKLFVRTTRKVQLSSLGQGFLAQARHLLTQFDAAIGDLKDVVARNRGQTVIACLPSVTYRLMPRVVATNEKLHPGIRVIVRDANLRGVITAVTSGGADLGIGSLRTPDPDLASIVIAEDQMQAVFPRDHPLARKKSVRWKDLGDHPFVGMTYETGIRELVDEAVAAQKIVLRTVAEVSNLATVNGMLDEGIGISALPGLALPSEHHPTLVHRPLVAPVIKRQIRVFWRRAIGLSPASNAILDALKATIATGGILTNEAGITWLSASEMHTPD